MLQQILRDMWVDPEILAELDETQKQTLFCKMREEQVRRWQIWDQKLSKEETDQPKQKNGKKQVTFMHGEDGEPWVWVMGEHPDDKSIDSMLEEEARARALAQARQEAHQLRRSVEKELTQLIDYTPLDSLEQKFELSPKNVESIEEALDIYCTVDELRQRIGALEPEVTKPEDKYDDEKLGLKKGSLHFNFIEGKRDGLQELALGGDADGVSSRVLAWERRVAGARAGDLLRGLRARRARALRDERLGALRDERLGDDDAAWREQERKAKEAEAARREIARAAREAHRAARAAPEPEPADAESRVAAEAEPPSREAVERWFRAHELPRGAGLLGGRPADWFHGVISRAEAERLLAAREAGAFLLRLSARARGYALSVRARARCRHFLVERRAAGYRLLGADQRWHHSLADLIKHHTSVAITAGGGELLREACACAAPPALLLPEPRPCAARTEPTSP